MKQQDDVVSFKILLIGSSDVGKTSLITKFIDNQFCSIYKATIGVQFHAKIIKLPDTPPIKMQIWDTMGQQTFKSVVRSFYNGTSAVILMYSIDSYQSFEQLPRWMNQISQNAHKSALVWLVGAKSDLQDQRKISKVQIQQYAKSIAVQGWMQVSAKTSQNVNKLFESIAQKLYKQFSKCQNFRELTQPSGAANITLQQQQQRKAQKTSPKKRELNCC